jgi:tRNA 2-selenouridine synthase
MAKEIQIEEFLELSEKYPIIDVRSPGEYEQAHIPGALNLPLFSNDERAEIGTIYKQKGRVKAVQRGLEIVGPKLSQFTKFALSLKSDHLLVHCWRGGMRSASMVWLLENVGISCYLLTGGYKSYRNKVLEGFHLYYNNIPALCDSKAPGSFNSFIVFLRRLGIADVPVATIVISR